jgi:hypothetical protein
MMKPPKIDERDSHDLVRQLRKLMPRYTPDLSPDAEEQQLTEAMIRVFARFGEIVIDRLNRAPEKNFLAFLQLVGVSNLPPRAAQVPLTFYLAGGDADFAVIPGRTQVATQPLKGEKDPVLFETTRELVVVSTRLTALFFKDGAHDRYSDLRSTLPQEPPAPGAVMARSPTGMPMLEGDALIPHHFYIGLSISSASSYIDRLRLNVTIQESAAVAAAQPSLEWELCIPPAPKTQPGNSTGKAEAALALEDMVAAGELLRPVSDTTAALSKSGEVIFETVPVSPLRSQQNEQQFWLVCRLLTPIVRDQRGNVENAAPGTLRLEDLPTIESVSATVEIDRADLSIQQAFFNNTKVDLSKDFFPFGERPKFGDTLYLGSAELFSNQHAAVVLHIDITNPAGKHDDALIPPTTPQNVKLAWEFWDGTSWSSFGTAGDAPQIRILTAEGTPVGPPPFKDRTSAFSVDGDVTFQLPRLPVAMTINGQTNFWIRVRIIAGNYGTESHIHKDLIGSGTIPASFAPPLIRSIRAEYQIREEVKPQTLIAYDDFSYRQIDPGKAFQPFEVVAAEDAKPAVYFGFERPVSKTRSSASAVSAAPAGFPSRSMCIYLDAEQALRGITTDDEASALQSLVWEYWNGNGWSQWTVRDETGAFRHPGLIRFLAPSDFAASERFGCTRYWLRVTPASIEHKPTIRIALLNTVMATGSTTIRNELLGVSNGMPDQTLPLLHPPVLAGQCLEILEPRMPGRLEQEAIRRIEGDDAVQAVSDIPGHTAVWVRWHQVSDFYASGPRDRHYVLDPLSGVIAFGDGQSGQIPPRGAKVRSSIYRSGGGAVGNRPVWNITQLKTAVPYIGKVCNWIPAGAGGDAEDNEALLERGSRGLRHRGRAVTLQDYEDLARLASPEVARAKCVPLLDLAAEPEGKHRRLGVVSVIVVPRMDAQRPLPGSQLMACVLDSLRCSSPPTTKISVVGPDFVRIDVTAEIVIDDPDALSEIELAVRLRLIGFLHPLTGGQNGSGWDFGRMPHKSDFYLLIQSVPGVVYVRDIRIFAVADRPDVEHSDRFLVCPGEFAVVPSLSSSYTGGVPCR